MPNNPILFSREVIRVSGIVQGVGFRPTVWRFAYDAGLTGTVLNDGQGVLIEVWGPSPAIDAFVAKLATQPPPLARIDDINRTKLAYTDQAPQDFAIAASQENSVQTLIAPDAATCPECMNDSLTPFSRRYRYPLTNCTLCGPRFSIIKSLPYDRSNTSMGNFVQCEQCQTEYDSPTDRRFHAQPNACHVCGPVVELVRMDGGPICMESLSQLDALDAACTLLEKGEILIIKGIGGFHLACDATNHTTVEQLRQRKQRYGKPFALMARDLEVIRRYAKVSSQEQALLCSAETPIVLLQTRRKAPTGKNHEFGCPGHREQDIRPISEAIAPGQTSLGFMLPYAPLYQLMLKRMNRPIVLTSANRSDEPQVIENSEVRDRLGDIADYVLWHNRNIVNRVDDSVVRVMLDKPQLLRRSRGYAPAPLPLPKGFKDAPQILAMGSDLKNTFCLIKEGNAIISQHMGDLKNAAAYVDYQKNLYLYANLFQHQPEMIVVDAHPDYLSSKLGRHWAAQQELPLLEVQHHHAHIAACLADNDYPLAGEPVLGVALDGLGYGADDTLWGGEFFHADYIWAKRLATFKPVALLGGTQAMREPWRNTYAHLLAQMGWSTYKFHYENLELTRFLEKQPLKLISTALKNGINVPLASSCGRLFDAVAAAIGVCRESVTYEGRAAIEMEALIDQDTLQHEDEALAYPFAIWNLRPTDQEPLGMPYIEPLAMWQALLNDMIVKTPVPVMAARFHKGLAKIIVTMIDQLSTNDGNRMIHTVVLSGGVFQNKTLLEQIVTRLEQRQYTVLCHQRIPANDGGLALGQAVIAAAISLKNHAKCV